MWFIGVEVEQETSAPSPKKNPWSAPVVVTFLLFYDEDKIHEIWKWQIYLICTATASSVTSTHLQ